ncbi:hypothetical protein RP20_CCG002081 [Aedes albopictus]|nr:uncharacterized protein LOC109402456 [Aedes albopictus]XP_019534042.2 uncharacterized protein LOC109405433 [Aedes albopictus]KXJ79198.1 hypothetical protein RP20_CCG002081 [Aedes albopictus]
MKFTAVLLVVAVSVATSAAPSPAVVKRNSVGDLVAVINEYAPKFEELGHEKDQLLQFARTGLFATYRHMNEDLLENLGNARNAIEYGFDEIRTKIAAKMLDGGDEECLLDLVRQIVDEQRALAMAMSLCSSFTTDAKDDLSYSFYEMLELLQRLSTALSEYVLWSFSTHNSVADPEDHANYLRRTYQESVDLWDQQVVPLVQFQLDAMEYNKPLIVAENQSCLDKLIEQVGTFNEYIYGQFEYCAAPWKAAQP